MVELAGPPLVSTAIRSKTLKDPIIPVTSRKKVVGDNSGRVIRKNWRSLLAPSISAASYRSLGMDCRPAMKIIML
ncbi:hypothetical protein D3C76_1769630 [compost metagenome]